MDADDSSDGSGSPEEQQISERPRKGFPPAALHQGFRSLDCDLVNVFEVQLLVKDNPSFLARCIQECFESESARDSTWSGEQSFSRDSWLEVVLFAA